jgi:hypothetical protein
LETIRKIFDLLEVVVSMSVSVEDIVREATKAVGIVVLNVFEILAAGIELGDAADDVIFDPEHPARIH